MSLSGLLDAILPDPALSHAVSSAGVDSLELTAPVSLRPFVVSALAADPSRGGAGRPVLAVTATGRMPRARAASAQSAAYSMNMTGSL